MVVVVVVGFGLLYSDKWRVAWMEVRHGRLDNTV